MEKMSYRRLGKSGLQLPVLSLGLWNNFGIHNDFKTNEQLVLRAFEAGITHFDLANNYGPPAGHAEKVFGRILRRGFVKNRDKIIISTKAGYEMWDGPYGNFGSRKYLMASIDQSLERMGLKYVDIFYHHRFDPDTDLYETMLTLRDIVLQGKALYVGLSNYNSSQLRKAHALLQELHVPYVITQPSYSMFNRTIEKDELLATQTELGGGTIAYSVLAQGLLSNKYISSIPDESRAADPNINFLSTTDITEELINKLTALNALAEKRKQSISQMALAWALRDPRMTSVIIGVRTLEQLEENLLTINNLDFSDEELAEIERILQTNN
ncbi:MAG: aldo/keto reductase [Mycoplasmatales bacterium]